MNPHRCKATTKQNQPCQRQAGKDGYCTIHTPTNPTTSGRPSGCTPEATKIAEAQAMLGGKDYMIAAALNIGTSTLKRWQKWGHPDYNPQHDNDTTNPPPKNLEPYREFRSRIVKARTTPIRHALAAWIIAAKEGDWRAAKEFITYVEEAARKIEVTGTVHIDSGDALRDTITRYAETFAQLEELETEGEPNDTT